MFWQDVLVGCLVSDATLRRAVATALDTAPRLVKIVEAISGESNTQVGTLGVIVERGQLAGDFPLHLSIYVDESALAVDIRQPEMSMRHLLRLSEALQCACLISDDSFDPASWLRVLPSGQVEQVMLDPDLLDEDAYVVISAVPARIQHSEVL
jgi:hypothetical protein